jgi:hypothetical protein
VTESKETPMTTLPDARFYRASLVLAPALLLASSLSLSALHNDSAARLHQVNEEPNRYYAFVLLAVLGSIALIAASYGLMQAVRRHHPRLGVTGGLLTLAGTCLSLVDYGTELATWQAGATGEDTQAMTGLLDRMNTAPGLVALLQTSGLATLVGVVLLSVGLRRSRLVPLWAAWALSTGLLMNIVGYAAGSIAVLDVSGVVLLVAMARAGQALLPGDVVAPTAAASSVAA